MARLIVKSPYIKCGGNQGADGYMRYIATRERVEIIPDDRPPTRKQEQLITKLTKDFPDVKELLEFSPGDCFQWETAIHGVAHHPGAGGTLEAGAADGWLHEIHRNTSSCRTTG